MNIFSSRIVAGLLAALIFSGASAQSNPNLMSNGSFEAGLSPWVDWGGMTLSTDAFAGTKAMAIGGAAAGGAGLPAFSIQASKTYTLVAQAKKVQADWAGIGVKFYDSAWGTINQVSFDVTSTTYAAITRNVVPPANSAYAEVWVWKEGANTLTVDEMSFREAGIATSPPSAVSISCTPTSGTVPLTVTCSGTATGATSWSWKLGTIAFGGTTNIASTTISAAGAYTITGTAANASGSTNATASITVSTAPPSGSNLFANNPSFESETAANYENGPFTGITGWNLVNGAYNGIAVSAGAAANGNNKLELNYAGTAENTAAARAPVTAGNAYVLTVALSKTSNSNTAVATPISFKIKWYNASGTLVGSSTPTSVLSGAVSGWSDYSLTATAPAGSSSASAYIELLNNAYPNSDTATFAIDHVRLTSSGGTVTPPSGVSISCTPATGNVPLNISCTGFATGATTWAWKIGTTTFGGTVNTAVTNITTAGNYTITGTATNASGSTNATAIIIANNGTTGTWQTVPDSWYSNLTITTWKHSSNSPTDAAGMDNFFTVNAIPVNRCGTGMAARIQSSAISSNNPFVPGLAACAQDSFLTEIAGTLTVPTTGTYRFAVDGDDAVDLFIGSTRVATFYGPHDVCNCTTNAGDITLTAGTAYAIKFRHQDTTGGDQWKLSVLPPGTTPAPTSVSISCTPTTGTVPLNVSCTGTATGATSWSWKLGTTAFGGTTNTASTTISTAGTYTITGTASNAGGSTDATTSVTANAAGGAPTNVSISCTPATGTAPLNVSCTGTATGATSWAWKIGTTTFGGTANTASTTISTAGTYTITGTASNASGSTNATATITTSNGTASTWQTVPDSWYSNLTITTWKHSSNSPGDAFGMDNFFTANAVTANRCGSGSVVRIQSAAAMNNNPFVPGQAACTQDSFLTEIAGTLTVPTTGTYRFAVDGDDAVDLFIGSTRVATFYGPHDVCNCTTNAGDITLTAGTAYAIKFRHQDSTGGDQWKLSVLPPGGTAAPTNVSISCTPTSGTVPLNVSCSGTATGATAWSWKLGTTAFGTTANTASTTITTAGTYTITGTASNASGSTNGTASITANNGTTGTWQTVPDSWFSGLTLSTYKQRTDLVHPNSVAEMDSLFANYATLANRCGSGAVARIFSTGQNNNPHVPGNAACTHDNYIAEFTGSLVVPVSGTYQFSVDGDDAVDLFINGVRVADFYGGHGKCNCDIHAGSIALTSGTHNIKFRFEEGNGGDEWALRVLASTENTPIPSNLALSCTPNAGTAPLTTSCTASATGTGITWSWSSTLPTTFTGTGSTVSATFSSAGAGTIKATATNVSGAVSITTPITVSSAITISSLTCTPTTGTLPLIVNCSAVSNETNPTWAWKLNGTTVGSNSASFSTTLSSKGLQTISVQASSANGTASKSKVITVNGNTASLVQNFSYNARDQIVGYSYDSNGNLLTGPDGTQYTYDAANRLMRSVKGADTIEYRYDALGNLVYAIKNGLQSEFILDENGLPRVIAENGANRAHYLYGPDGLAAKAEEFNYSTNTYGAIRSAEPDGHGGAVWLGNSSQSNYTVEHARYHDAFGKVRANVGNAGPMGYSGEQEFSDGTQYLRARSYLPSIGRFLQRDTFPGFAGSPQSLNRYAYTENNPINRVDPTGHFSEAFDRLDRVAKVLKDGAGSIMPKAGCYGPAGCGDGSGSRLPEMPNLDPGFAEPDPISEFIQDEAVGAAAGGLTGGPIGAAGGGLLPIIQRICKVFKKPKVPTLSPASGGSAKGFSGNGGQKLLPPAREPGIPQRTPINQEAFDDLASRPDSFFRAPNGTAPDALWSGPNPRNPLSKSDHMGNYVDEISDLGLLGQTPAQTYTEKLTANMDWAGGGRDIWALSSVRYVNANQITTSYYGLNGLKGTIQLQYEIPTLMKNGGNITNFNLVSPNPVRWRKSPDGYPIPRN